MMESMFGKRQKKKLAELPLGFIESEILPRLPAKDVGRCRCVCKQWKSFLSTPMFVREHLQYRVHTIDDYKGLLLAGGTFCTLDGCRRNLIPDAPYATFIIGSIDGLVCLATRSKLAFWNPLTGAYKTLPPNRSVSSLNSMADIYGFYIDSSNDYKLVQIRSMGFSEGGFWAFLYTHRLGSWRELVFPVELTLPSDVYCISAESKFCGHRVFFAVNYININYINASAIICFDVKTEEFRKIGFPPVPFPDYRGSIVVLNECIHLCVSYMDDMWLKRGDLWRMDGNCDGWVKVAGFRDSLIRQPICTASTGYWVAVLEEENNSFKRMNTEDFMTHYRYFSPPIWENKHFRIIYAESLVSP